MVKTHAVFTKETMYNLCSVQRLGMEVAYSLVIPVLSVGPGHAWLP